MQFSTQTYVKILVKFVKINAETGMGNTKATCISPKTFFIYALHTMVLKVQADVPQGNRSCMPRLSPSIKSMLVTVPTLMTMSTYFQEVDITAYLHPTIQVALKHCKNIIKHYKTLLHFLQSFETLLFI